MAKTSGGMASVLSASKKWGPATGDLDVDTGHHCKFAYPGLITSVFGVPLRRLSGLSSGVRNRVRGL